MTQRIARLLTVSALLLVMTGCTQTYVGRFLTLRGPDVEDYRDLPTRTVPAATGARAWREEPDAEWMDRIAFAYRDKALATAPALDAFLAANGTTAFLVISSGQLVHERYYNGYTRDSLAKSFSMSKSVLSALFGIAEADGLIARSDRLGDRVPGIEDPRLAEVTLQQLLDNVAGLEYERGFAPWKQQPRMYYTMDVRAYVRAARVAGAPGKRFVSEDLSPLLVGLALERALQSSGSAQSLSEFAAKRLWQPIGAEHGALWTLDHAGDGMEKTESGFVAQARDLARFGQLYLDAGAVNGLQVVPAEWVAASSTRPAAGKPNRFTDGFHANLWWGADRPGRTASDYFANGHFGQRIYVSPDKALVLVRLGASTGDVDWTEFLAGIADRWPAARNSRGDIP